MSAHDGGGDADEDDILANRRAICRLDTRSIPQHPRRLYGFTGSTLETLDSSVFVS